MFDKEMAYLAASRDWLSVCGIAADTVTGRRHSELLPHWPLPWPEHHANCLLGIPVSREEDVLTRADGGLDWLRWRMQPWFDEGGAIGGSVMFAEIVTGRKKADEAEQRLMGERASRAQVLDILESISDAFLAVDRDWRFTFVNRAAQRVLRRDQQDLVGRHLWTVFPEAAAHPLHARLVAAFNDQVPISVEEFHPPTQRWFEIRVYPSRDSLSIYFRDITQVIRLQETLRRNERMSAMGSLVAGVAHQVRNPLFGITLALDALQQRLTGRADLARYFATLEEEARRVSAVMQDLLEFGKPAAVERQAGNLAEVVRRVAEQLRLQAEARGVTLTVDIADTLPPMLLDQPRIPHVFQNLIDNAIQHSPAGGEVRVIVRPRDGGGEPAVRCEVCDQGRGFPSEDLSRVFEPFFSRRQGGTGLGLAIVQRIVDEHGGRAWASNRNEGGAMVVVELPVIEA